MSFAKKVWRREITVDRRDARMIERRKNFGFALEANHAVQVTGERFRQNLDSHIASQLRIPGAIDLAHPARTNSGDDFIGAETAAGDRCHEHQPT